MDILLVNVGNTCTTVAAASGPGRVAVLGRQPGGYSANSGRTAAALARWISSRRIGDAVVCSVVPAQTGFWRTLLTKRLGRPPMVIGARMELGVTLAYPEPGTIGADRLADICAAANLHGAPVLVIDIGTAATFNMVREDGSFIGGAIAPGPALFTQYLADRTAQLPLVGIPSGRIPRVGKSTRQSISLSVGVGYKAMVIAIAGHIMGRQAPRTKVVVTGGYARRVMGGEGRRFIVDPLLTLRGMACAYSLNRSRTEIKTGGN